MLRRLVTVTLASLVLAPLATAVPDPVANPEHTFVLTRQLPNGRETTLATWVEDGTFTNEQLIRQVALEATRQQRTNNPAWFLILYGPTNGGPHTEDDAIWNSTILLD